MKNSTWLVSVFVLPSLMVCAPGTAVAQPTECDDMGCNNIGSGSNGEHYTFWDASGDEWLEGDDGDPYHWGGLPGSCMEHHACEPEQEDREEVYQAVLHDDPAALKVLQASLKEKMYIHTERSLLQLLGCNDQVVLSLPLTQEQQIALVQ